MSHAPQYEVIVCDKFVEDLLRLAADARTDRRTVFLRQQVLAATKQLADGTADGRHALGYEAGKGDLRDCVTAYLQSDPQLKADHRLVFRELPPAGPGRLPRRELVAVKPRHGPGDFYDHTCR